MGSSKKSELERYDVIIHLTTPLADQGYNHQNPIRIESATQADEKIKQVWKDHPERFLVESGDDLLNKVNLAMEIIGLQIPDCSEPHQK